MFWRFLAEGESRFEAANLSSDDAAKPQCGSTLRVEIHDAERRATLKCEQATRRVAPLACRSTCQK